MNNKNWPDWIKGGIPGGIIYYFLAPYISIFALAFWPALFKILAIPTIIAARIYPYFFAIFLKPWLTDFELAQRIRLIFYRLPGALLGFLVGIVVILLYKKFKNRKTLTT